MGARLISPEQGIILIQVMKKGLRRPIFRHTPGFAFHTSWSREGGYPRPACTKIECINTVVDTLEGKGISSSKLLAEWLDRVLPNWRHDIGLTHPDGSRNWGNYSEENTSGKGQ